MSDGGAEDIINGVFVSVMSDGGVENIIYEVLVCSRVVLEKRGKANHYMIFFTSKIRDPPGVVKRNPSNESHEIWFLDHRGREEDIITPPPKLGLIYVYDYNVRF